MGLQIWRLATTPFKKDSIMSILIGADIVPTESNKAYFDSGNIHLCNN